MRLKCAILVLLLAVALCGCGSLRERQPWGRKDIPLTPLIADSSRQMDARPLKTGEKPSERPAPPAKETKPLFTGQFSDKSERIPSRTATDKLSPKEPPPPNLSPMKIDKPTMLENLVLGAEPIDSVETLKFTPPPSEPPAHGSEEPASENVPGSQSPIGPAAHPSEPAKLPPQDNTKPDLPHKTQSPVKPPASSAPPLQPRGPRKLPKTEKPEKIVYDKAEVIGASLLQINDKFFTVDDISRRSRKSLLSRLPNKINRPDSPELRKQVAKILQQVIRNLVIESLVHAEAKKRMTDQQTEMIESELAQTLRTMIAEAGGSRKKLEADLAARGENLKTMLANHRRILTVRRFLQGQLYPAVSLGRRELWNYYRKNPSEFSTPKKVQMQIIAAPYYNFGSVQADKATETERLLAAAKARQTIQDASDALKTGEDFGPVAMRFSRGIKASTQGIWSMMPAGSFRQAQVEQTAFAMADGQVSNTITTPSGYYIVKALKVQPGESIGFQDAQDKIQKNLRDKQFAKLQQEYFQRLLKGAEIRQPQQFLDLAVDHAIQDHIRR